MDDVFAAVDHYIEALFVEPDPALDAALRTREDAGMPAIQISPSQGKLLYLLAKLCHARRILEIGTLAGYSTIWLGRSLPANGRLISLEFSPDHAAVARANLARAGLDDRVEVWVGKALDSLPRVAASGIGPFDVTFIDADKHNYPAYLDWAIRLSRPGALIVADNVVRAGRVVDPDDADELVRGVRAFNAALATDPRVEAILVQQVGAKHHDGLAIARVRE